MESYVPDRCCEVETTGKTVSINSRETMNTYVSTTNNYINRNKVHTDEMIALYSKQMYSISTKHTLPYTHNLSTRIRSQSSVGRSLDTFR